MKRSLWLLVLMICTLTAGAQNSRVTKEVMSNGIVVLCLQEPVARTVSIEAFIRAGLASEPPTQRGVRSVTARCLFGATENQTLQTMAMEIDRVGGSIVSTVQPDFIEIGVATVPDQLDNALYVLTEGLKNARFDETTVARARFQTVESAREERLRAFRSTFALLRERTLPVNHPYHGNLVGDPDVIAGLSAQDIEKYHREVFVPQNLVIVVAGNIEPEHVRTKLATLLGDWNAVGRSVRPTAINSASREPGGTAVQEMPIQTTYTIAGGPAPGLLSADYPTLLVLEAVLGGGKTSRIFKALRETDGIGYEVGAIVPPMAQDSFLMCYVETAQARGSSLAGQAQNRLVETVTGVVGSPPAEKELERARRLVVGNYAMQRQRLRERAYWLGLMEAVGGGWQRDRDFPTRVMAVTSADVMRLARRLAANPFVAITMPGAPESP